MLYVAEIIYKEVSKIKKENPNIPNVEAIERFIGTEIYNLIGSGEFHNNLYTCLDDGKLGCYVEIIKRIVDGVRGNRVY